MERGTYAIFYAKALMRAFSHCEQCNIPTNFNSEAYNDDLWDQMKKNQNLRSYSNVNKPTFSNYDFNQTLENFSLLFNETIA